MNRGTAVFGAILLIVVLVMRFVDPIAQDPAYYLFADQRNWAGIPNFLNVTSNIGFVVVGVAGFAFVARHGDALVPETRLAWLIFFAGITATCFGSGWFHWAPSTESLIWDRLPMTIGFMSFVSIIASEYFSRSLGKRLLWPLLIIGFGTVAYWAYTEQLGRGDLRPYAMVQFLPMLAIPLVLVLHPRRSDLGRYVGWMIGFYMLAKVCEHFDQQIYALGEVLSGHSLKHLVAALSPAALLLGLRRRRRG